MNQKKVKHAQMEPELASMIKDYGHQNDLNDSQVMRQALREFFTKRGWILPGPQGSQVVRVTNPKGLYLETGE